MKSEGACEEEKIKLFENSMVHSDFNQIKNSKTYNQMEDDIEESPPVKWLNN